MYSTSVASPSETKWQGKRCVIRTLYWGEQYFGIVSYFQYLHILGSKDIGKNSAWQRSLLHVSECPVLIKSAMFFTCAQTQIKWIRQVNTQRQQYIREVLVVIECILTFCVIAEVEVIGKSNALWI